MDFCGAHKARTAAQWEKHVQAVADFRHFVHFPQGMKRRHARRSAPRTIMSKKDGKPGERGEGRGLSKTLLGQPDGTIPSPFAKAPAMRPAFVASQRRRRSSRS